MLADTDEPRTASVRSIRMRPTASQPGRASRIDGSPVASSHRYRIVWAAPYSPDRGAAGRCPLTPQVHPASESCVQRPRMAADPLRSLSTCARPCRGALATLTTVCPAAKNGRGPIIAGNRAPRGLAARRREAKAVTVFVSTAPSARLLATWLSTDDLGPRLQALHVQHGCVGLRVGPDFTRSLELAKGLHALT